MSFPRLGATPENAGPIFWRIGCPVALPTCVSLCGGGKPPGGRACRSNACVVGHGDTCYQNGMDGIDLRDLDLDTLIAGVRLARFAAQKLINARGAFLRGEVGDGRSWR